MYLAFCNNCGAPVEGGKFCKGCGTALDMQVETNREVPVQKVDESLGNEVSVAARQSGVIGIYKELEGDEQVTYTSQSPSSVIFVKEAQIKKVIGRAVGFGVEGLDTFLTGTSRLINKGLSKVDKRARKIRAKNKRKCY